MIRIRQRLGPDYPLIFDSGVRSGEDIVKALACGANLVMLGRPMLFALGADGARGLRDLVVALAEEIRVTLAQLGLRDIQHVGSGQLADPETPIQLDKETAP